MWNKKRAGVEKRMKEQWREGEEEEKEKEIKQQSCFRSTHSSVLRDSEIGVSGVKKKPPVNAGVS